MYCVRGSKPQHKERSKDNWSFPSTLPWVLRIKFMPSVLHRKHLCPESSHQPCFHILRKILLNLNYCQNHIIIGHIRSQNLKVPKMHTTPRGYGTVSWEGKFWALLVFISLLTYLVTYLRYLGLSSPSSVPLPLCHGLLISHNALIQRCLLLDWKKSYPKGDLGTISDSGRSMYASCLDR